MTREFTTTIHGITVKEVEDEEVERLMEKKGYDDIELFIEELEQAAEARLAQCFEPGALKMLEVVGEETTDGD